MKTQKQRQDQLDHRTVDTTDTPQPKVKESLATIHVSNSQGETRLSLVKRLCDPDLLAFVANPEISFSTRVATIASINNPQHLIDIALGNAPTAIRRNALQRLDWLNAEKPLSKNVVKRLVPCLNEKELIAFTVTIMDVCDFDWCAHSSEDTVDALCDALRESSAIHETVLLEDSIAHLAHSRHDLHKRLLANNPESFITEPMYAPLGMGNILYPNLNKKDNVA